MMSLASVFTVLLLLPLSLFSILSTMSSCVNGDVDLIQKTCKVTKYYDLCVSTLKSDPTSATTPDTKGLALIVAGAGLSNATATSTYFSSQVLNGGAAANATALKKALKDCSDKYTRAGEALQNAGDELASESYDYAYMHVMAAADYPNGCRNAFRRVPGLVYPPDVARREQGLKRICDVLLGIIDNLVNGS